MPEDRPPEPRDTEEEDPRRPAGPLESLFQEAVRRATGLGISGLASTEEAMRKAFQDRAPREWQRFLSEQGDGLRGELAERLASEFASFLRSPEFDAKLRQLLGEYEVSVRLTLRADPRGTARPPEVDFVPRARREP